MKKIKRVLLINDLTSFGKCSLTVSIPVISSLGIECVPLPTELLSNHTGFSSYKVIDNSKALKEFSQEFINQDISFDCIYTGFFKDYKQIDQTIEIINKLKKKNTLVFVDPILGENGKLFSCFNKKYLDSMKKLVKLADFISPNITEACLLTDCKVDDNPKDIISKLDNKYVVITSIKRNDKIGYLIKDNKNISSIYYPLVNKKLHGTGDVFSSYLCGEMINTKKFKESCLKASKFTNKAILNTLKYSNHNYGIAFEDILKAKI